jgi:hypothetical protein
VGSPDNSFGSHGFFTGLMTEEYHSSPYYGEELPVTYVNSAYALSSAWMWIDEYNGGTGNALFFDSTDSAVSLTSSESRYFASNGVAEASNAYGVVTGLLPVNASIATMIDPVTVSSGGRDTISVHFRNSGRIPVRITNVDFTTDVTQDLRAMGLPIDVGAYANTTVTAALHVANFVQAGTHAVSAALVWEFFDTQMQEWVSPQPYVAHGSITVQPSSAFPLPTFSGINSFLQLPFLIPAVAGVGAALIVSNFIATRRRRGLQTSVAPVQQTQISCAGCGSVYYLGQFSFCPLCGHELS